MKEIKNRINNVKEESLKLMGIYFIVLLITFITVLLVYFIGLFRFNKSNNFTLNLVELKEKVNDKEFELLTLNEETSLKDKCDNGCKIKTGSEYYTYYEITKENDSYILDINLLYRSVGKFNIGTNISNLIIKEFAGYNTLFLTINNNVREYDEAIVIKNNEADIFVSSNAGEMEFKDSSIIYYTYSCIKNDEFNAVKFRNERKPFTQTNDIITYEYINLGIC
jgi:hypothetical protein